jgi:hypothetical protein
MKKMILAGAAVTALAFLLAAGTAGAQVASGEQRESARDGGGNLNGREGRVAPQKSGTPRIAAGDRSAVISKDGDLVRGVGVTSSRRVAAGRYQVIFDKDVRNCVYNATVGNAGAGEPQVAFIGVARRLNRNNGVYVQIVDFELFFLNSSFHLHVVCP